MKRKLIITGVLIISQIFFVYGQSTITNSTIASSTPSSLKSSLSTSTSTSSPSFSPSSIPTSTTNSSTNSTTFDLVIYPYNTVRVPPNNGTWQICAQENTNYASYSVRVVNDSYPLTPDYGTTNDSQLDPNPTAPTMGIVARIIYSDGLEFIPSLSCYSEIVIECDQDAGTILMKDSDRYCLQIINPGQLPQRVNVTVNFKSTVFKNGGFTSDNKPGGNTKPLINSNSSTSINCKSTFGIFAILIMSWFVLDTL